MPKQGQEEKGLAVPGEQTPPFRQLLVSIAAEGQPQRAALAGSGRVQPQRTLSSTSGQLAGPML